MFGTLCPGGYCGDSCQSRNWLSPVSISSRGGAHSWDRACWPGTLCQPIRRRLVLGATVPIRSEPFEPVNCSLLSLPDDYRACWLTPP